MNLKELIKDYLNQANLMQIATFKNGKPWVASVWYVVDDSFNLYFISRKTRRHSLELKENPNVAGAIVVKRPKTLGLKVVGIQFEGRAVEVSIIELPKAYILFTKRFPKATMHIKSIQDIIKNVTEQRIYKIIPSEIVLFDEINFPNNPRQELKIS